MKPLLAERPYSSRAVWTANRTGRVWQCLGSCVHMSARALKRRYWALIELWASRASALSGRRAASRLLRVIGRHRSAPRPPYRVESWCLRPGGVRLLALLAAPLGPGHHPARQVRRFRAKGPRPRAVVIAAGIRGCEERTARVVCRHSLGAGKSTPHAHAQGHG